MNTSQAGQGQLRVELAQPPASLQPCRCRVQEVSPQDYRIQYTPNDPGRYQLRLLFNNQLVQGKTFDTDVHVAPASKASTPLSLVHIQQLRPIETPEIGDDVCLQSQPLRLARSDPRLQYHFSPSVSTEHPSVVSIQGQISCGGMSVPCQIERNKDSPTWQLTFRPYVPGTYKIHLFHNGSSIMSKT